MNQEIKKGINILLNEANKIAKTISVKRSISILKNNDFIFIDLRDYREILKEGKIPGSFSCPRGMLEFWIDPKSPYHKNLFNQKKNIYILLC